jgi:hypothetical protein
VKTSLYFGITALGDFGATAGAACQEYLCGMKYEVLHYFGIKADGAVDAGWKAPAVLKLFDNVPFRTH